MKCMEKMENKGMESLDLGYMNQFKREQFFKLVARRKVHTGDAYHRSSSAHEKVHASIIGKLKH